MTTTQLDSQTISRPRSASRGFTAPIVVQRNSGREPGSAAGVEPISFGMPFGRGMCPDERALRLADENGRSVPLQAEVLERWRDGSVKWALIDFQHGSAAARTEYFLSRSDGPASLPDHPIVVDAREDRICIDTGAATFTIDGSAFPFRQVSVNGRDVLSSQHSVLHVEDAQGHSYTPGIERLVVEYAGPVRTVVCVSGSLVGDAGTLVQLEARLHFFAGLSTVRVALTLRNPRRAEHPGGFWELGDAGSVLMRSASLRLALQKSGRSLILCSAAPEMPFEEYAERVEVYQDSSGGDNWMSPVHVNREGRVPNSFRGYRVRSERGEARGLRATPHVAIVGDEATLSVTVPHFWQNFPKAIEAAGDSVVLGLWPAQYGDVHELQGGEQKTHVFDMHFHGAHFDVARLAWGRHPSIAGAAPEWYAATGAMPFLSPAHSDPHAGHRRLIAAAIEGPDSFAQKREIVDEYGWRNFGELYADHEAVFHRGDTTFVSHYNNQYDAVGGFATQFLRTGDARWWAAMDELASHVVDIDIYHTSEDKSAYNGGLFWHTCHHIDAGRSTHRSYPHADGTQGGGPGNEHNYSSGLLLHYLMTGNRLSANAVVSLARWVQAMEDGRRTPFALLSGGDTGLASSTDSPDYHGPGRGAAYSVQALLDGFRLTGDRSFMDKAEQLIRRCIHPDDDVEARDLLDIEPRWSYTVFLQMLGRYLEYKREIGECDEMYAYARASLLRYARWMVDHESPYLEHPERLEFPNETWVAQDARKSEVFDFAARHGGSEERVKFLEKAEAFWSYAIDTLAATPTRTLTRPLALMLGHGLLRAYMRLNPDDQLRVAEGRQNEGERQPRVSFVPQKQRAKTRLVMCAAVAALGMVLAVVLVARRFLI